MTRFRQAHVLLPFIAAWIILAGGRAQGASIWVAADKTIAAAPLTPLLTPEACAPFRGFRYPVADREGNFTFITDDSTYSQTGTHHGIYRFYAADNRLRPLVTGDDLIPGTHRKFEVLRGLQADENGVNFVFNATSVDDHERGLFYWKSDGCIAIARQGVTILPGETAPLSDVHWGAVDAGRILYVAADASKRHVLVLHDLATGSDRVLLRDGDPIPGHPEEVFRYIAHQNWLEGNQVVFRASSVNLDTERSAKNVLSGIYGWFDVHWDKPDTLGQAKLTTVADSNTLMPGLKGEKMFADFRGTPVCGGLAFFRGAAAQSGMGIYFSTNGGPVFPAVDSESEIQGAESAGELGGFSMWPVAVPHGVLFAARAGKFMGAFLYREDEDLLYVLADSRTPVDGKTIAGFEFGSTPQIDKQIGMTVTFDDKTSGIYLAHIPAPAYKRLAARAEGAETALIDRLPNDMR